jgi:mycothiol synthase
MVVTAHWTDSLTAAQAADLAALVAAAQAADGVRPFSDDVMLTIRPGVQAVPGRSHLLALAGDGARVSGYAQLARAGGGWEAELVVHPDERRHGTGTALVDALCRAVALAPGAVDLAARPAELAVWAHGDGLAAAALAARTGFDRGRVLLQLRRALAVEGGGDDLPAPVWPAGVTVRAFEPGKDEDAWLALNALAFAGHPEQGRWTEQDLLPREREPWFDPAGFFLAERDGQLVGFHWTKIHTEDPAPGATAGPVGEVYVIGVHPRRAGGGLGRALTLAGLRHLRDQGLATVMLYTDEDNERAVRLYERLGFTRYAVDAQYHRGFPAG